MKKLSLVVILAFLAYAGLQQFQRAQPSDTPSTELPQNPDTQARDDSPPRPGAQFQSEGVVVKVLADDRQGSRHQRFIVRLASGRTVLIAHNLDLAPRVEGLEEGDTVAFSGDFEENDKGGVVHWTHHDPSGRHEAGWIKHRGHTYQ